MGTRFAPIVPTTRAAALLALAAPVALVIGATRPDAWVIAPLAGIVVFALVFVDALLAGRLEDLRVVAPRDVEVGAGEEMGLHVRLYGGHPSALQAALACDPRLVPGGRMTFDLASEGGGWRGTGRFTPSRRGTGRVSRVWLRWTGPLGLGARQLQGDLDEEVSVWPNIAAVRSPALQTFLKDAQFGLIARRMRGEGTQFESLAEYEPGMDRRRIDWKASARHVHLYAKEYETERNNQIVFAFDCGQAMCEPIQGMPRLDRAVSAALATAYVALKGGDRAALFGFASRPEVWTPFVAASGEFHRLQRAAAGLEYRPEAPNFTLALATLASRLQRRSLIVVFSDFSDPTSAELMIESIGRLVSRHVVVFVTMTDDELESFSDAPPDDLETLSEAVSADLLLRQRALVTHRLRQLGVDVVEAPFDAIGPRLLDAYLDIKRSGAIG
ncbi:DUF58 domain-containing protein [Novosphingobium mangrovi (ex Huang et al. 2023)]|uniref:DUF58 domain-containing protein n=1 Tax=Novosphingobium mangrovi (ex Huang et al. 2023) TaxID=2976432 RepID=A0ABT2I2L2_9SPHN|nr:DUF58 domain-containing protein [Novosphingobium mangrovi (ex Huang et al. 2023)]MCT2399033.1 DUF58 domain-containing protein [Novosphingobium mangrovi (ex Huang et al. 2023)]